MEGKIKPPIDILFSEPSNRGLHSFLIRYGFAALRINLSMNDSVSKKAPRASGFVAVTNELICDPGITALELRVGLIIGKYPNRDGFYGTVKYIAEICGVSDRTIQRTLRSLEQKRLIVGFPRVDDTTVYRAFRTKKKIIMRPDIENYTEVVGVTPMSPGGDKRDIYVVTPMSPKQQKKRTTEKLTSSSHDEIRDQKETNVSPEIGDGIPSEGGDWTQPSEVIRKTMQTIAERARAMRNAE